MAGFLEYYSELIYRFPTLQPILAQRFVNRAWVDIQAARRWSFLLAETALTVPEAITTGTVTVTQGSTTVTPSASAITALDAAGSPLLSQRQFSLGAGSPVYGISAYDGATITLDRDYQEDDASGSDYKVFTCYFDAPTDFASWITIRDIQNAYNLRLHYTQREINRLDPQRATTGDPLYLAAYKTTSASVPRFELWPHPSTAKGYPALYQRAGVDFASNSESLPQVIGEDMLINRALFHVYRWAMEQGLSPNGKVVDWRWLMMGSNEQYKEDLKSAARQDNEAFLEMVTSFDKLSTTAYPIDANYAQNHPVGTY